MASWGTDEGKFIRIFTQRSRPQLAATFPEYKKVIIFCNLDPIKSKASYVGQQSTVPYFAVHSSGLSSC